MPRQSAKFKPDELINYDELLESSSMTGLVSFLTEIPSPTLGIPNEAGGLKSSTEQSKKFLSFPEHTPKERHSTSTQSKPDLAGVPTVVEDSLGIPNETYAQIVAQRHLRPIRMRLAQDGHSQNEQAVYWSLWNLGEPVPGKSWKSVQVGYGDLARKAGVSRNSAIRLLLSLEKKLALKRFDGSTSQQGSCYTIYDFATILESRKQAGLLFAVRDRNGVHLLTGEETMDAYKHSLGIPKALVRSSGIPSDNCLGIPKETSLGIPAERQVPVGIPMKASLGIPTIKPVPYRDLGRDKNVVVVPDDLLLKLRSQTDLSWDSSALHRLWADSSEQGIETVAELMVFVIRKWQIIRAKRNVKNPVGLMLKAVPESISPEALTAIRAELDAASCANEVQGGHTKRDYYEAVLGDPEASQQEKLIATRALETA